MKLLNTCSTSKYAQNCFIGSGPNLLENINGPYQKSKISCFVTYFQVISFEAQDPINSNRAVLEILNLHIKYKIEAKLKNTYGQKGFGSIAVCSAKLYLWTSFLLLDNSINYTDSMIFT